MAAGTLVPEDAVVESGALVMGVPARERRRLSAEERTASRENARRYVRNAVYQVTEQLIEVTEAASAMAIDVEVRDGIAIVTMNRPEALNAFSPNNSTCLGGALYESGLDRAVRAAILTGAGDRAFAAGADIKAMAGMTRGGRSGLRPQRPGHGECPGATAAASHRGR